jgi:hypothetical protein
MTFTSMHGRLGSYAAALSASSMVISALAESGAGIIPWLLAIRDERTTDGAG